MGGAGGGAEPQGEDPRGLFGGGQPWQAEAAGRGELKRITRLQACAVGRFGCTIRYRFWDPRLWELGVRGISYFC